MDVKTRALLVTKIGENFLDKYTVKDDNEPKDTDFESIRPLFCSSSKLNGSMLLSVLKCATSHKFFPSTSFDLLT